MSLYIWGEQLQNNHIILRSDSQSACEIVNSQEGKCDLCLTLVIYMVFQCLKFNIKLKCIYIKGVLNNKSDALSRNDL